MVEPMQLSESGSTPQEIEGDVVVAVVSFNSGDLLPRCLGCLQRQTVKPSRIVVVDNASNDAATLSLLNSLTEIEIIRLPRNIGYGGALNRVAATMRTGDLLCCLNPDAFVQPQFLEELTRAAQLAPDAGSFAPLMVQENDPGVIDDAGDIMAWTGYARQRWHGRHVKSLSLREGPVFGVCGGACLLRLSAFMEVGGFDETFFMYAEDTDLGFRLQLAGYPCLFVPNAVVRHIRSASTGFESDFSVRLSHRNVVWMTFKCMPASILPVALLGHLLMTGLLALQMLQRGQLRVFLHAKWEGVRGAGRAWHERKRVIRRTRLRQFMKQLTVF